jgi:sortase (surface protein transpeptidase)
MVSAVELRRLDVGIVTLLQVPVARTGRRGRRQLLAFCAALAAMSLLLIGCGGQEQLAGSAPAPTSENPAAASPMSSSQVGTSNPTALIKSTPTRIEIPSIGVDSTLMGLGLDQTGAMQVPPGGFPAGWYTGAPTPGEDGPAVIAGHVDWDGEPGVFFDLRNVKEGAAISVTRQDGTVAKFEVTRVSAFAKAEFPTELIYGSLDYPGLRLITCGGSFDESADSYDDNIVAFATLVGSS